MLGKCKTISVLLDVIKDYSNLDTIPIKSYYYEQIDNSNALYIKHVYKLYLTCQIARTDVGKLLNIKMVHIIRLINLVYED